MMKQPKPNKSEVNFKDKDTELKKSDKSTNKFVKFKRSDNVKDRAGRKYDKKELKSAHNDPAFYTRYKELSDNAARIAFNHRNGSTINFSYGGSNINRNIDPIMIITYVPTIGRSVSKTSGINVAAQAAYKVLNRKYRGSPASRYQSSDLGISQFAIMDFYLSLAQAERAYGVCQMAKVNQRQLPREVVFALGFDYEDISQHLANFRAQLNALIVRAQVLCLVKGYPFIDHHLFLLSNIFKDKDTARGQYFAYKKPGYWLWNPTKFASGSAVEWIPNRESRTLNYQLGGGMGYYYGLQTMDDVIYNLNQQLNALIGDSDIDAICADILALFDNTNEQELIKLSFLPDGYMVDAIFDQNALYQLHNTVFPVAIGCGGSRTSLDATNVEKYYATPYPTSVLPSGETGSNHTGLFIYQLDDTIRFDAVFAASGLTQIQSGTEITYGSTSNVNQEITMPLLDTDILNPSPDEVLEMTRNVSIWWRKSVTVSGSTYYIHYLTTMGTTLICSGMTFKFGAVGEYSIDSNGDYVVQYGNGATAFSSFRTLGSLSAELLKFDWAPIKYDNNDIFSDLDNYRGIEYPVLNPIHEAAILSEFHNPISDILIKDI